MRPRWTILFLRLVLGLLFLYAGAVKIADPVAFAGTVAGYRLLPYAGTFLLASVLPWLEALCGVLLIVGMMVRSSALLLFLLNGVFIAALASTVARGLTIDCGCFRSGGAEVSPLQAVGRDLVIAVALAALLWLTRPPGGETSSGDIPSP